MSLFAMVLASALVSAPGYRAFWVDAFHPGYKSPAEADQLLEAATAAKANALFVQMRRRGDSYFLRSLEPPASDPDFLPGFDALDYLIRRAHERGIEVHAWCVVGPAWRANLGMPPDPRHVYNAHGREARGEAMWLTVSDRGELSYSLDLGHPEAARYLADVILEPVRNYDIDGLHLDYIRYPAHMEYPGDWGRNPAAVERYHRLFNRSGKPDAADPRWSDFRRAQVTALTRQIYLRAHALKPRIKVSAALITWGNGPESTEAFESSHAYSSVFQDWRAWLQEGILDLGLPMNYFREDSRGEQLDRWLAFEKDHQYGRMLVPGLGAFLNPAPASLAQATRVLAPSPGGRMPGGIAFYAYGSLTSNGLPAIDFCKLVAAQFGDPGPAPSLPWLAKQETAHVHGWLTVEGGPKWLKDGADVVIEGVNGAPAKLRMTTDATGFFGALDVPPGRYRVRVERGGREVFRTVAERIGAGESRLFHLNLSPADFTVALPHILAARPSGRVLELLGFNLGPGEVMVLSNGTSLPVLSAEPNRIVVQVQETPPGRVVVRRAGMDSEAFDIPHPRTQNSVPRPAGPGSRK